MHRYLLAAHGWLRRPKSFEDISEDRSHLDSPMLLINALALKMSDQEEQGNTLLESWQGRILTPHTCLVSFDVSTANELNRSDHDT
ncbi:MAG: hypothetical protein IPP42_06905 [Saprospiraceae bacterium]|nr:hypothetical protein [Saprospiraceae bacterium]